MRRSVLALAGTAIGITLMVGAKLAHPDLTNADVVADAPQGDDGTAADGDGDPAQPSAPVSAAPKGSTGALPAPSAKTSTAASPRPGTSTRPPAPAPSTAPAARYKDGTFAGPAVQEKYGSITVTVVISGGVITKASATCSCSGDSLDISTRAFNGTSTRKGLNRSTLDAQSASISTFSGATYTSTAYKQSLASALAKAKP
jgi:uncharacterized protein with FMN-binding domain